MKTLVTGCTGFLGRNAMYYLSGLGWDVVGLARNPQKVSQYLGASNNKCTIYCSNAKFEQINNIIKSTKPDVVIHLAALSSIKDHQPNDIENLLASNITYGVNILEAMRENKVTRLVISGTAWQHYNQINDEYNPANLYAATKQAFEDIAKWYVDACGFSIISLHFGDIYGPEDNRKKIFKLLVDSLNNLDQPVRLTAGEQELDPLFITDAVSALAIAVELCVKAPNHSMNIFRASPGKPILLRNLVQLWYDIAGVHPPLEWGALPYRTREVMKCWLGGRVLPDWTPQITLEQGFRIMLRNFINKSK